MSGVDVSSVRAIFSLVFAYFGQICCFAFVHFHLAKLTIIGLGRAESRYRAALHFSACTSAACLMLRRNDRVLRVRCFIRNDG